MLLYYFDGADDLLLQAVLRQRGRRVEAAAVAAGRGLERQKLSARVRAIWPVLIGQESGLGLLDQAIGLAMYDPQRYSSFGREAQQEYLPTLLSICPEDWPDRRKVEVAEMILAALRGFLVDWRTSGDRSGVDAGFEALTRALDREEAAHE
ncbi:hypothetical protein AB4305_15875 [Nocardia sp. 2YAB30]|uniref:hypothetical protein n=1 Tax=unclassified Nocardia TaxID=2637762 RepID=UPI003F9C03DB